VSSCRHKVQEKLDEQTKKIREENTAREVKEEEQRQRTDNLQRKEYGDFTERHEAWQVRQNRRNQELQQLTNDPALNSEDESQRHAAESRVQQEIARITAAGKQDPEPKQNKQGSPTK